MEQNCRKCKELDNERMVQCDACDRWYHFNCVGVDSDIADISWNCEFCASATAEQGAAESAFRSCPTSSSSILTTDPLTMQTNRQVHFAWPPSTVEPALLVPSLVTVGSDHIPAAIETLTTAPAPSTSQINMQSSQICKNLQNVTASTLTAGAPPMYSKAAIRMATGISEASANNNIFRSMYPQENLPTTSSTYRPSSQACFSYPQEQRIFTTTQPTSFATSAHNFDSSSRIRNLQLERLEEEMKLQKQYLDSKYNILSLSGEPSLYNNVGMLNSGPTPAQLAARHAIPKQLPTFNGDPEEWPLFVSSFENSTTVAGFSNAENLSRLQLSLKGKAREMVKNKLLLPVMVPEIMQTLRMCFGRPELILERVINKARAMPAIKDKLEALIEYALCIRNICATMEGCQMQAHLQNPLLVKELVDKLPNTYKLSWAMQRRDEQVPVVKAFSDWMYQMAEAASTVVSPVHNKGSFLNTHTQAEDSSQNSNVEYHTNFHPVRSMCSFCKCNDHKVPQCENFKMLSLNQKWEAVKTYKLCRQCLGAHRRKCFINKECGIDGCKIKHHQLLHKKSNNVNQGGSQVVSTNALIHTQQNAQLNSHSTGCIETQPYFRIIPICIHSKNSTINTYAFLDEGSAVTLIEKNIFQDLGLRGTSDPLCLRWTGDTTRTENDSIKSNIEISNVLTGKKYQLNEVHTIENLGLPAQSIDINAITKRYPYLKGLPIKSYSNVRPTVLIGANNWKLAVPMKIREGSWSEPIASKTRLGWTLQGCDVSKSSDFRLNIHTCDCREKYEELHEAMKNYFSLESPKPTQLMSSDNKNAMAILDGTCRQQVNGQYEIGLPWRDQNVILPNSYENAFKRLWCLRKKFKADLTLKSTIQAQIDNLLAKGYAKKLSKNELRLHHDKIWYLPIFVIKNPNKPGKIRLVWDAASKSNGASLNDFLLTGPDLLNPLLDVLLAFRVGRVAVCGDIEEMFHRIKVRESDMHAQRFLWWDEEESQQPNVYVMQALTFGMNCAPCIAHFIRDRNAQQYKDSFSRAVEAIQKHHYVDDFIDSEDDEHAALKLAYQVKQIHAAAGFNIRNWASNSSHVLKQLLNQPSAEQENKAWDQDTKVLGMVWDPTNDIFKYSCRFTRLSRDVLEESIVPTKRETLQVLMSIFDPLGFLSCYTIGLKILLQDIWRSAIGWDEPLTDILYSKWCQWKSVLKLILAVEIPRCYSKLLKEATNIQLHTFVDAGEKAYAAVCYLRIEQGCNVTVTLVLAKAKVAPLKPLSIPRLELQAAIIGVRLATRALQVPRIKINSQYWWTDSKTVLKWLKMDPKNFQQFVMHRVGEILETSNVAQWRWVPSKLNPADLATKTAQASFRDWFSGPAFLQAEINNWPQCDELGPTDETEIRHCLLFMGNAKLASIPLNVEYFSNWKRLYRAVATFMLWIKRLKAAVTTSEYVKEVDSDMVSRAQQFLFQQAQLSEYSQEISDLNGGKNIKRASKLTPLNIYLDNNGLIRSKGRAENLNNREDAILLPTAHHVSFLLVRSFHETSHHQMHETTINQIRGQYYIPRLRVLYRKVRRMCQQCKNNNATPQVPQMSSLPAARLAVFERPFTYVGIDYFGPLFVAVGRRREKRWGVIFTCLTVRAIHIEVAHSLDTSSCIMCIRNFTSRRGMPKEIFSDNGTNFKAAEKIICDNIKDINFSLISSTFDKIKWRFNPPAAPHMGGIWERLVRSVKTVLYSICPSMKFTDESVRSALWEIEFIINSRPLTFVSLESNDDDAITPNHLLIGSSDGYKPISNDKMDLRQRWHQTQLFADQFWRRWLQEYVPIISRRSKWFTKQHPLNVNDIVVIVDQDLPRNCWPKGRVIDRVVAKDGQVRRVTVKTMSGVFQRPVAKVAVLDVGTSVSKLVDSNSLTGAGMLPPI